MTTPLSIVLIEPEIPQNTGNIGRTCVGLGLPLHLVGELGFSLSEREIKRAGLDYWDKLEVHTHKTWSDFQSTLPKDAHLYFFSTRGETNFAQMVYQTPAYLIFGSEGRGLPPSFYETYKKSLMRIPTNQNIRSLNLATSVGIAAYDVGRKLNLLP